MLVAQYSSALLVEQNGICCKVVSDKYVASDDFFFIRKDSINGQSIQSSMLLLPSMNCFSIVVTFFDEFLGDCIVLFLGWSFLCLIHISSGWNFLC